MSDDTHEPAVRSKRIDQLRALAERGATEGERTAAAKALADYEAKHAQETSRFEYFRSIWPNMGDYRVGAMPSEIRDIELHLDEAARVIEERRGIHDAEVHAGKIGMFVVWRVDHSAADGLRCWSSVRIRVPSGEVLTASRCKGLLHDTENDRWGVLYRAKDLR